MSRNKLRSTKGFPFLRADQDGRCTRGRSARSLPGGCGHRASHRDGRRACGPCEGRSQALGQWPLPSRPWPGAENIELPPRQNELAADGRHCSSESKGRFGKVRRFKIDMPAYLLPAFTREPSGQHLNIVLRLEESIGRVLGPPPQDHAVPFADPDPGPSIGRAANKSARSRS